MTGMRIPDTAMCGLASDVGNKSAETLCVRPRAVVPISIHLKGLRLDSAEAAMLHPGIMPYGNMRYLMLGKSEVSEIHGLTGIS
jgi:hypothetical protein